jgi:hypothetical protein
MSASTRSARVARGEGDIAEGRGARMGRARVEICRVSNASWPETLLEKAFDTVSLRLLAHTNFAHFRCDRASNCFGLEKAFDTVSVDCSHIRTLHIFVAIARATVSGVSSR